MRRLLPAAAAALFALSACDNALTSEQGPLTGTWRYTATGFKALASNPDFECEMETEIVVTQWGDELEGRSKAAPFHCVNQVTGAVWDGERPAGVVRGEVQDGRVHFSNAGDWHSFGEVHPDRVEGFLESYGGISGQPMQTVRSGAFVLERISHEGYDGPRA